MQISYNGLTLLKELEGFRSESYLDTGGVWTIGYGTTRVKGKPVEAGLTCTEAEAAQWLSDDIAWAQTAVNKLVKVPLKQGMFDALVSFVYNVGEDQFRRSTLLRLLNLKQYIEAGKQFLLWKYDNGKVVQGLLNRRHKELAFFMQGIS
jgi:lysozyme